MPARTGERNRGPAAAADNRRAILAAARRLFAERGYRVPLSAVAKEAGVGQGVLYRHFPTRLDLAYAVFEENFVELEAIAAEPDEGAFGRLWARLVDLTIREAAFVEMVVDARRSNPAYDGGDRLLALTGPPLDRARDAGLVAAGLTASDVMVALRMAFGVVVTATGPEPVRDTVDRALALLDRPAGLGPTGGRR